MKTVRTVLRHTIAAFLILAVILLLNAEADDREARQNMNLTGEVK
jgi:hypothetical protein